MNNYYFFIVIGDDDGKKLGVLQNHELRIYILLDIRICNRTFLLCANHSQYDILLLEDQLEYIRNISTKAMVFDLNKQ